MLTLTSDDLNVFRDGVKRRISVGKQYDLLPTYGCMCWIGQLFFGRIFVDNIIASEAKMIIVQCYKASEDDVEKRMAASGDNVNDVVDIGAKLNMAYRLVIWSNVGTTFDSSFQFIDQSHLILYAVPTRTCNALATYFELDLHPAVLCRLNDKLNNISCPEGYSVRTLTIKDALTALTTYKYRQGAKERFMLIAANGYAFGIFDQKTNEMVSSALVGLTGEIGALQTTPEHQRKGLGKALISHIAQVLLEKDFPVFCYIEEGNFSVELFKKLGFTVEPNCILKWGSIDRKS